MKTIKSNGIEAHFRDTAEFAQTLNGDWVTTEFPESVTYDGETRPRAQNGIMVDPVSRDTQGNAAALGFYQGHNNLKYAGGLNWKPEGGPAGSTQSLVITKSNDGYVPKKGPLERAIVLTVVPNLPSRQDLFRPGYSGHRGKKWYFPKLKRGDFKQLANPGTWTTEALNNLGEQIYSRIRWVFLDLIPGWQNGYLVPATHGESYGTKFSRDWGDAMLLLELKSLDQDLWQRLSIALAQLGIDLFSVAANDGYNNWFADGGHSGGRKAVIMWTGRFLGVNEMLNIEAFRDYKGRRVSFGEDQQTYYEGSLPEWRMRPGGENPSWSAKYRRCCTATVWRSQELWLRLYGLEKEWGWPAYFDYLDRYAVETVKHNDPGWMQFYSQLSRDMYTAYRHNTTQEDPVKIAELEKEVARLEGKLSNADRLVVNFRNARDVALAEIHDLQNRQPKPIEEWFAWIAENGQENFDTLVPFLEQAGGQPLLDVVQAHPNELFEDLKLHYEVLYRGLFE